MKRHNPTYPLQVEPSDLRARAERLVGVRKVRDEAAEDDEEADGQEAAAEQAGESSARLVRVVRDHHPQAAHRAKAVEVRVVPAHAMGGVPTAGT